MADGQQTVATGWQNAAVGLWTMTAGRPIAATGRLTGGEWKVEMASGWQTAAGGWQTVVIGMADDAIGMTILCFGEHWCGDSLPHGQQEQRPHSPS